MAFNFLQKKIITSADKRYGRIHLHFRIWMDILMLTLQFATLMIICVGLLFIILLHDTIWLNLLEWSWWLNHGTSPLDKYFVRTCLSSFIGEKKWEEKTVYNPCFMNLFYQFAPMCLKDFVVLLWCSFGNIEWRIYL